MRKLIAFTIAIVSVATIISCSSGNARGGSGVGNSGELIGVGGVALTDPTPYGMVLVERGSIKMGPNEADTIYDIPANPRGVSIESFWMDQTEITNSKYKQFVLWVRDSIIRERLADPSFGGNEDFKIEEDKEGNPIKPHLNWNKPIPWAKANEDERRAIESVYRTNPITGQRELDAAQFNFRYEIYNQTEASKRKNRLEARRRVYNTDVNMDNAPQPIISKDTAYIDDNGAIVRETITRPLTGEYDFLNTYIINIYPDTTCWVNDFENAYNEPYVRLYFSHAGYNDYPVVGVSWDQANAFAAWRTEYFRRSLPKQQGFYIEPYRLPTEAEWEYAARAGEDKNKYPWEGDLPITEDGCFYANFKPMNGNYIKDGNLITARVGTYAPNNFGLYDMAGNVSEWTSTAYTESISKLTNDINPEYRYYVAKEDPYKMSRKIVRGGSWKDVAKDIRSDLRMWEYANEQRSYIGFRCVRTQVGFAKGVKSKK